MLAWRERCHTSESSLKGRLLLQIGPNPCGVAVDAVSHGDMRVLNETIAHQIGWIDGLAEFGERLAAMGIKDTSVNIRNKVSRGKFMASFMLQCLRAIGVETLRLEDA